MFISGRMQNASGAKLLEEIISEGQCVPCPAYSVDSGFVLRSSTVAVFACWRLLWENPVTKARGWQP